MEQGAGMLPSRLKAEARHIISRNVTANVAGADIAFIEAPGHIHLSYFLFGTATGADEQERELALCELIACFPEIRTAVSAFGNAVEMPDEKDLIFSAS
ncbi:MAG: hypothetical protein ACRECY_07745 [Phyllobacterium sp.]